MEDEIELDPELEQQYGNEKWDRIMTIMLEMHNLVYYPTKRDLDDKCIEEYHGE